MVRRQQSNKETNTTATIDNDNEIQEIEKIEKIENLNKDKNDYNDKNDNNVKNDNVSFDINLLKPGTRITVRKRIDDEIVNRRAEIMSVRWFSNRPQFYVHFIEFNKRLDGWVGLDMMDLESLEDKTNGNGGNGTGGGIGTSKAKSKYKANAKGIVCGSGNKGRKRGSMKRAIEDEAGGQEIETSAAGESVVSLNLTEGSLESEAERPNTPGTPVSVTLEAEIESLRRGGSMTQRTEEISRVKNIDKIEMGEYSVEAWYFSPYPQDIIDAAGVDEEGIEKTECVIYLCDLCLECFGKKSQLIRHRTCPGKCPLTHPPGNEIYRNGNFSFFEIDGHKQKTYCRRLCLLSKLFLDHKTLFYDVDPFLFYILTENSGRGSRILGYFSKEKESLEKYNLACILTLPQHQRKGYGRLLIEFSYELSKREGKIGSPEKPLSDLGLLSYRSFWAEVLVGILKEVNEKTSGNGKKIINEISIDQLSTMTSFTTDDILHTLQAIDALRYHRGQHVIILSEKILDDWEKLQKKIKCRVEGKYLQWTPPVFTASQLRFL